MIKNRLVAAGTKPFTEAILIDLTDISAKDRIQLIYFENNNAAFFAKHIVLIEGDSDIILFPHIVVF